MKLYEIYNEIILEVKNNTLNNIYFDDIYIIVGDPKISIINLDNGQILKSNGYFTPNNNIIQIISYIEKTKEINGQNINYYELHYYDILDKKNKYFFTKEDILSILNKEGLIFNTRLIKDNGELQQLISNIDDENKDIILNNIKQHNEVIQSRLKQKDLISKMAKSEYDVASVRRGFESIGVTAPKIGVQKNLSMIFSDQSNLKIGSGYIKVNSNWDVLKDNIKNLEAIELNNGAIKINNLIEFKTFPNKYKSYRHGKNNIIFNDIIHHKIIIYGTSKLKRTTNLISEDIERLKEIGVDSRGYKKIEMNTTFIGIG